MLPVMKDKEHLFRMAGLFVVGVVVFFLLRVLLVPRDFGDYGHYRTGALTDAREKPIVYAGAAGCAECHGEVLAAAKGGPHASVSCESCHGPLAVHATKDPGEQRPPALDKRALCLRCHTANVAKPKGFKQVDPKEHGEGEACTSCHMAHAPNKQAGAVGAPPPPRTFAEGRAS